MKTNHVLVTAALALCVDPAVAAKGPSYAAVVNDDGSLARGRDAVSSQRVGPGQYEVVFAAEVHRCAYNATIGLSGSMGSSVLGTANVAARNGNKSAVLVQTFDAAGNPFNLGFHVIVAC